MMRIIYKNIKYGGVTDDYEFAGIQQGLKKTDAYLLPVEMRNNFKEVPDVPLYTGLNHHHTISLKKLIELKGLELLLKK